MCVVHEGPFQAVRHESPQDVSAGAREPDIDATSLRLVGEPLDHVGASRVEKRHGGEIHDQRLVAVLDPVEDGADGRRRAEEQRAGDAVDDDLGVRRRIFVVGFAGMGRIGFVATDKRRLRGDGGGLAHPLDEENRAKREACHDGFGQIAEDGEEESRGKHGHFAPARPDEDRDGGLLDHVPGDDRQNARKCRQRYVGSERCGDHYEEQEKKGMQHSGDRSMRARPHVCRRSRDRTRDAKSAEECGAHIGHALCNKLAVRAVPPPGHAVGDNGGQKRLDGAQKRE